MREVSDEAERCALLAEGLATRWERSARIMREKGTYETWSLWPFGKRVKCVAPSYERGAKELEAAAHGLRTVARLGREGADPRKFEDEIIVPTDPITGGPKL